jgi:hypothetical protein
VTVDTDRTQALIGFLNAKVTSKNLSADVRNAFASLVLSSMDGKPIAQSGKLLLTAGSRVTNTNLKWNEAHTRTANQGESPTLIEPVTGVVSLCGLQGATGVSAVALDGTGHATGEPVVAKKSGDAWSLPVGDPATTWYLITVKHR